MFHGSDLYVTTEDGLARVDGSGPTYPSPNKMPLDPVGWVGDGPLFKLHGHDDVYFGQVWAIDDATSGEDSGGSSLIAVDDDAEIVVDTVSIAYDLIDADSIKHPTGAPQQAVLHASVGRHGSVLAGRLQSWSSSSGGEQGACSWSSPLSPLFWSSSAPCFFSMSPASRQRATPRGGPGGTLEIESAGSPATETPGRAVIPQRIRWTDTPERDVPVSESLAVGHATLAFSEVAGAIEHEGIAVVITADGDYRRLSLPGTGPYFEMLEERAIQLSPNGTRLAYVTEDSDLNVIDLETGESDQAPPRAR